MGCKRIGCKSIGVKSIWCVRYECFTLTRMTQKQKNFLRHACAAHLKDARIQMGLSQMEVAKLAGIERSWYAKVDAGLTNISIDTLDKARRVLVTTVPQPPSLVTEVGKRIAAARQGRYSQEALSEAAGLNIFYVGRVERGTTNPGLDQIEAIAIALKIDPLDILAI